MIGATTARHSTDADFDIDIMAQIAGRRNRSRNRPVHPCIARSAASAVPAITTKLDRKTRCSTVHYVGMHLDLTPAVRLVQREEKTSFIFHSKPSDPNEPKLTLLANPHGFGQWFLTNTPADEVFGLYFEKASLDYDRARFHRWRPTPTWCRRSCRPTGNRARSSPSADQAVAQPRV